MSYEENLCKTEQLTHFSNWQSDSLIETRSKLCKSNDSKTWFIIIQNCLLINWLNVLSSVGMKWGFYSNTGIILLFTVLLYICWSSCAELWTGCPSCSALTLCHTGHVLNTNSDFRSFQITICRNLSMGTRSTLILQFPFIRRKTN